MDVEVEKDCSKKLLDKDGTAFKEYTENTTAHGVVRIFKKEYSIIRRLFWLLVVVGAAAGCLYNCIDRIGHLASSPTSTAITSMRVRPSEFPAVTVCNTNAYTASGLEVLGLREVGSKALNIDPLNSSELSECERITAGSTVLLEDLRTKAVQPLDELILECSFAGESCDLDRHFEHHFSDFGSCYTFNGKSREPVVSTYGTGSRQGLFLILNIDQSQYTASPLTDAGVSVYVHSSREPAQVFDQGITVPPGRVGFISMRKETTINNAGVGCTEDYDNSRFNFIGNEFDYSSSACLLDCQLTAIADNCSCYHLGQSIPPSNPMYANLRNCTFSDVCCIQKMSASALDCNCLSACTSTVYDASISYSRIPAEYSRNTYRQVFGNDSFVDINLIGLSVFYKTLDVRLETTRFSYSAVALLSDIGGQLGLFLGISVISILEFCTWLFDEGVDRLCCLRISRKGRKQKKMEPETDQYEIKDDYYNANNMKSISS